MSLREKTDSWTKWILKETDTDTYTKVVHEIFERLWLCVERFDESNNNHEYVILANLFVEEIYTDPWSVYSQIHFFFIFPIFNSTIIKHLKVKAVLDVINKTLPTQLKESTFFEKQKTDYKLYLTSAFHKHLGINMQSLLQVKS